MVSGTITKNGAQEIHVYIQQHGGDVYQEANCINCVWQERIKMMNVQKQNEGCDYELYAIAAICH